MTIKQVVNKYYIGTTYIYINTIYIKMYQKVIPICYFCYINHPIMFNFKLNVPIYLKQLHKIRVFTITT
jgi:hypothetical protein